MVQYTVVYINSAKHSKIKMINFQRVKESRRKNNQEPRLRTTDLDHTIKVVLKIMPFTSYQLGAKTSLAL